ncbi:hydroxymethylglutaryl-CoA lyase [Rhodobacterales bacterium HKCCE2091]|nr:hydroxymethylglutaryl-CoA lyase [Rhodobacterales bacterium HKCCE2091]
MTEVTICECIARDGLQHEPGFMPTADKLRLIAAVAEAGFTRIEATSYSSPKAVPAFADASEVLAGLPRASGRRYKATAPNLRAVERALADRDAGCGAEELSLLVSASEGHSRKNLRAGRDEQWDKVTAMAEAARGAFTLVGVVSTAFACPFDGPTDPETVVSDARRFADLGCALVTIGDTTGHATPARARSLFADLLAEDGVVPVAHFHDTRGTGLANCLAALEAGCRHFDSAIGGTGGNPAGIGYGEGYTGNVATEDLVNMFEADGIRTGTDWDALMAAAELATDLFGRPLEARSPRAGRSRGGVA